MNNIFCRCKFSCVKTSQNGPAESEGEPGANVRQESERSCPGH